MGPSLIFDKSLLESLSVDKAVLLDQLYMCTITPLFFTETLADLEKHAKGRPPAEMLVSRLAERTPVVHSYVCVGHWECAQRNLLGYPVEMGYRPMVAGGVPVKTDDGEGVVFRRSPEQEAFERWQRHEFHEVERLFAKGWRQMIAEFDLPAIVAAFRAQLRKESRPRTLEQSKALVEHILGEKGLAYHHFRMAMDLMGVPGEAVKEAVRRWKLAGSPPLHRYAPYAAHCIAIDLFFYFAMANGLISDQRPTNRIDIAYLYYLPFTNVFTSSDKLHRRLADLFLMDAQAFVWGPDLKNDLAEIEASLFDLPEAQRALGLFHIAARPPTTSKGVTASLWDRYRPGWRSSSISGPPKMTPALEKVVERSNALMAAAESGMRSRHPAAEPDTMLIERSIPKERGRWRMFGTDFENPPPSTGK